MDLKESLYSYVESRHPIIYLVTLEEDKCDRLIRDLDTSRKILEWNMAYGHVYFDSKTRMLPGKYRKLSEALDNWLDQDLNNHFLIIKDAHLALCSDSLSIARLKTLVRKIIHDDTRATIFLVSSQQCVPPELEMFITVIDQPTPNEEKIGEIIREHAVTNKYSVNDDLTDKLVLAFRGLSEYVITRLLNRGYIRGGDIDIDDVKLVIDEKRQIIKKSGILEIVSVTDRMDDIGGLSKLKAWLERKARIMADIHKAREFGVEAPKGAMIVGMSGCGKSLTAKAISVRFELPLLRLDIGSVMGMYVGESEANMRQALRLAETVSPCVLWVDELEKAFAGIGRGTRSSISDITNRLCGNFLTWMQEKTTPVFVVATANDISTLPPEFLRKGRFDEVFYVLTPKKHERAAILKVHLRKRKKDPFRVDVEKLAGETCGFSGADLEGVVKDAIEDAFLEGEAELKTDHLLRSMKKNKPHDEMQKKIEECRANFEKMGFRNASE